MRSEMILAKATGKGFYWLICEVDDKTAKVTRHEGDAPTHAAAKTGLEEFKLKAAIELSRKHALNEKAREAARAETKAKHGDYDDRRKKADAFREQLNDAADAFYEAAYAKHRKALGLQ